MWPGPCRCRERYRNADLIHKQGNGGFTVVAALSRRLGTRRNKRATERRCQARNQSMQIVDLDQPDPAAAVFALENGSERASRQVGKNSCFLQSLRSQSECR